MRTNPFKWTAATVYPDYISASTNFTRPNDTDAYAIGDAMSDSTGETPTILSWDFGASVTGSMLEISRIEIVTSASPTTLLQADVLLSATTFAQTADNSALAIAVAALRAGMLVAPVTAGIDCGTPGLLYAADLYLPIQLAAADTKLYGTLRAKNAYAAGANERFDIKIWARVGA